MGIQDLNQLVREKAPTTYRRMNTDLFRGRLIAVDTPLLIFATLSAAYSGHADRGMREADLISETPFTEAARDKVRKQACTRVQSFAADMLSRSITPLFVFDGTAAPEKTSGARKRRAERRAATAKRISDLRAQILDVSDPLLRSREDIALLRKLMRQQPPINPNEDMPIVRSHIANLGLPSITAPDEAEKFCAYLSACGIAAASYTRDTDSFAFGAPCYIVGFSDPTQAEMQTAAEAATLAEFYGEDTTSRYTHFKVVVPPVAFHKLQVSRRQFVELCIMLSCDFNTRMPGFGKVAAWKLFKKVLDETPSATRIIERAAEIEPSRPWDRLNAEVCRRIFLDDTDCRAVAEKINVGEEFVYKVPDDPIAAKMVAAAQRGGVLDKPPRAVSFYS